MRQELLAARAAPKGGGVRRPPRGLTSRWRDEDTAKEPSPPIGDSSSATAVPPPLAETSAPSPPPVAATRSTPPPLPPPCVAPESQPACELAADSAIESPSPITSIPLLEPPRPLAERASFQAVSSRWLIERWRDTPSWLASLVLHLTVLIAFGSLIVPPGKLANMYFLTLSLAEQNADTSQADLTIVLQSAQRTAGGDEGTHKHEAEPIKVARHETPAEEKDEVDTPLELQPIPTGMTDDIAALFDLTGGNSGKAGKAPPLPDDVALALMPSDPVAERRRDTVVDRFIEFDIGKLQGAEGEQARRDFDRLGIESIPALVRGLNKSAYIHASCPVGVLSNKLQEAAQRSSDRAMIQYALDNIGRGVPDDAPHAYRLKQLRQMLWQRYVGERENVRHALVMRGLPDSEDFVNQVQQLSKAPTAVLAKQLDGADVQRRVATTVAISLQPVGDLSDQQRTALARRLIQQLEMGDAVLTRQSDQTLERLTHETVSRPMAAGDPAGAAQQWRAHWDRFEREKLIGPRARSLLVMADILDNNGKREAAVRRYREVVTDFYGTEAADEARQRLAYIAGEGN
jgi:hypothetical protein